MAERTNQERRSRVLLVAFGCSPYRGSEPEVGWRRVLEIAKHHDAWVLYEKTAPYEANIRKYLAEHGEIPGLQFYPIPFSRLERALRRIPGCLYLAYNLWQRRAYREAARLHEQVRFELVHHVNLGTYREPGYPWRLNLPVIWGPVGGVENLPWRFWTHAGLAAGAIEALRTLLNTAQFRCSPRVRKAARRASVLFVSSSTGWRAFKRVHGVDAACLCDCGADETGRSAKTCAGEERPLRVLWMGSLWARKALDLLLRALGRISTDVDYEVRIVGDGPMARPWRELAERLGLRGRCQWMGRLSLDQAREQYDWADVLAFTSLRDTVGTVVPEALSYGVPLIALDHQGAADVVTEHCGIKIPVTTVNEVVEGFADAIAKLSLDRAEVARLSRGALERAQEYVWSRNGQLMQEAYRRVLDGGPATAAAWPSAARAADDVVHDGGPGAGHRAARD